MDFSRLNTAYTIGRLNRYTQNPNQEYWSVLVILMKYLRGTINYGILYSGFPSVLEGTLMLTGF